MNVTITGGTGFIGRRLVKRLLGEGHAVHLLVRPGKTGVDPQARTSLWNAIDGDVPEESLADADAVVHLAGEPIAQRWTPEVKRRIRASRVDATRRLAEALSRSQRRPGVLVCASAIGYYGSRDEEALTESSPPGEGFLPEVCVEWETAAREAEGLGVRVVNLRTGIVLGPEGGALERMLPPFRLGAGGRLGSGTQWMSWIHVEDHVSLIRFAIDRGEIRGPLNATAPNPVRNSEFTEILGRVLHRPAWIPVPAFVLKTLFGEMSEVLLGSQRVLPKATQEAGFSFQFPELPGALRQLLG